MNRKESTTWKIAIFPQVTYQIGLDTGKTIKGGWKNQQVIYFYPADKDFMTLGLAQSLAKYRPAKIYLAHITFNYLQTACIRVSWKNSPSPDPVNESINLLLGNTRSPFNRYSSLDIYVISGPCLLISSLGSIRESQITGSGLRNELNFWFLAVNANPNPILPETRSSACILFGPIFLFLIGQDSRPLLPIDWRNLQILRSIFDHWPIQHCLRYQKAKQLLLLGDNLC